MDPYLEVGEIVYGVNKAGSTALFFENVKGSDLPLAMNVFGTDRRLLKAMRAWSEYAGDLREDRRAAQARAAAGVRRGARGVRQARGGRAHPRRWLAITGEWSWHAVILGLAVGIWIGGFDLIYACQDVETDRRIGVKSVQARFGIPAAIWGARACHTVTTALFVWSTLATDAGFFFWLGLIVARCGS
ncbi:4-hydroxybenzoate polyprenyltransferase, mitochondrial [Streptomyces fumanus]